MVESKTTRNARLKAMRKKFGLGEFKNKKNVRKRIRTGVHNMAKKRFSMGKSRSGNATLKNALAGIGASHVVNSMGGQFLGGLTPVASYFSAYYVGGAVGLGASVVYPMLPNVLSGVLGGVTNTSSTNGATF